MSKHLSFGKKMKYLSHKGAYVVPRKVMELVASHPDSYPQWAIVQKALHGSDAVWFYDINNAHTQYIPLKTWEDTKMVK